MAEFEELPWWQQRMYIEELAEDLTSGSGGDDGGGEQWAEVGEDALSEHFTFTGG